MPRITTYAIDLKIVQQASTAISKRVSELISIPSEYVVIQVNTDAFVRDGKVAQAEPFVEVCLFDRGLEKEDAIAVCITEELAKAGCPAPDVYLTRLERRRYFENGVHF